MSNFCHLHVHTEFCLAGDTLIYNCVPHKQNGEVYRNDYTRRDNCKTIKYLYDAETSNERGRTSKKYPIKVWDGEKFVKSKIKSIQKSEAKQLYKIETESGKSIRASKDHRFLSDKGWKIVKELKIGSKLACNGVLKYTQKEWLNQKYIIENLNQEQIANICGVSRQVIKRQIKINNLHKTKSIWMKNHFVSQKTKDKLIKIHSKKRSVLKKEMATTIASSRDRVHRGWYPKEDSCELCSSKKNLLVHHKNRNPKDNSRRNRQTLCNSCHKWEHSSCPLTIRYEKITSIEKDSFEETYDIEVCHPAHNFIANGFVTHNSLLDGFGSIKDYVARAKELGHEYLACTDHANIDGLIQFQKECGKADITPIFGSELYIVPDMEVKMKGDVRYHVVVLVKNDIGWKNLCSLLTEANLKGMYYKPRIDFASLLKYSEGLVILSGCLQSFILHPEGKKLAKELKKLNRDVYLEVQPHDYKQQKNYNNLAIMINNNLNLPLVATNDCHYINKEDSLGQEVLLAVQTRAKWDDKKRMRFEFKEMFLKSEQEMRQSFSNQGTLIREDYIGAIKNTVKIAEMCSKFKIKKRDICLPEVNTGKLSKEDFLLNICYDTFKKYFSQTLKNNKEYFSRFNEEFSLIKKKNFIRYFLIVHELISWCKEQKIMVGPGRGSCGGSLVAFLMGITSIDPIEHNLLFSRFIDENRQDLPDIDIDFEDIKRPLIRKHLEELYGENNVASISTFMKMKGRSAIRDVARVFDIPLKEVGEFTKLIFDEDKKTDSIKIASATKEGSIFYKKYKKVCDIAMQLEGQVRNSGQHAAALVISAENFLKNSRCNLAVRSNQEVINWDKEDVEHVGLTKLDILGLNTLTILNEIKRLVKRNYDKEIDFEAIELNDKRVFKMLSDGDSVGVFQFNTWAMQKLSKEIEINNFKIMSDVMALVRPGPSDSGMTEEYIKRKRGARWEKKNSIYESITKDTYGIIVYQEQVMEVINKVAGLSYSIADKIRKIIGKKRDVKEFDKYYQMFVDGCLKQKTLSKSEAKDFWAALEKHSNYSFNRAHSTAYSILAFWCAWAKIKYPAEFICANLSYGSESKKEELVKEAKKLGLKVITPKIGVSDAFKWVVKEKNIYIPFIEVKGLGEKTVESISQSSTVAKKKRGFFNTEIKANYTEKVKRILTEIGAIGDNKAKNISDYFSFKL